MRAVLFRFSFLLVCIAVIGGICLPANASTVQKVRFAQTGIVMVWDETGSLQSGAEVNLGAQSPVSTADYIGARFLEPIEAAYTGDNQMTIKVASNAPILIMANASAPLMYVRVEVVSVEHNASLKGQQSTVTNRIVAGSPEEIFRTESKTARTKGSAESQALTLQISWSGEAAPAITISALDQ